MDDDVPQKPLLAPFTCPTCWKLIEKPEEQRIVVVSHDPERDVYLVKRYCRKCHPPVEEGTAKAKPKADPKPPTN